MSFPRSQLPIVRLLRVPGPCFHCRKIGYLRATCPKLGKLYPLNNIECVDNHLHKCACPETDKSNGGSYVTPHDVCVNRSDAELVDSQPGMCAEEEIIELGLEFTRSWEFEQVGTQITDVHGQLLRNVTFWEQALHAPTNY